MQEAEEVYTKYPRKRSTATECWGVNIADRLHWYAVSGNVVAHFKQRLQIDDEVKE